MAASWQRGAARAANCLRKTLLLGTHEAADHASPGSLLAHQKAEGVTGAGKGWGATGPLNAWQQVSACIYGLPGSNYS